VHAIVVDRRVGSAISSVWIDFILYMTSSSARKPRMNNQHEPVSMPYHFRDNTGLFRYIRRPSVMIDAVHRQFLVFRSDKEHFAFFFRINAFVKIGYVAEQDVVYSG